MVSADERRDHAAGDESHTAGNQGVNALEEVGEETADSYPLAEGRPARRRRMSFAVGEPRRRRIQRRDPAAAQRRALLAAERQQLGDDLLQRRSGDKLH
jgi:hypothetical protein